MSARQVGYHWAAIWDKFEQQTLLGFGLRLVPFCIKGGLVVGTFLALCYFPALGRLAQIYPHTRLLVGTFPALSHFPALGHFPALSRFPLVVGTFPAL